MTFDSKTETRLNGTGEPRVLNAFRTSARRGLAVWNIQTEAGQLVTSCGHKVYDTPAAAMRAARLCVKNLAQ